MSTLLCASCGHSFPEMLLEPASFSDRIGRCLSQTTQLVRETRGKTSEDAHRLVQLGQLLQQLCGMMEKEVHILQDRQKDPRGGTARVATASVTMKTSAAGPTTTKGNQRDATATTNGTLTSTSRQPQQQQQLMMTATNTALLDSVANAAPLRMFEGAVPQYQLKRMASAFDLVSATLYNVLESLAVQCRAGVALLWLRHRQNSSSDLVAPFVVGRELSSLAHSAPYSTPETSVPAVVCQTGVALNLIPQPHPSDAATKGLATDLSLAELMEQTNAAQLLVPVHDRYAERHVVASAFPSAAAATTTAEATTAGASATPTGFASVIAVLHLIGSPLHPAPFHRHNEEAAAQTAALLSYILSSYYDAMIAEWTNRFYIPATLQATAKYTAALDMRPEEKGIDDFTPPPQLIFRTTVGDPRDQQSANEARDALKMLQQSALRKSTPLRPMANVKDLCHHATNMEANWVSAVQQTARLEKEVGTLEEDLLRRDVAALLKAQEAKNFGGGQRSMPSSASGARLSPTLGSTRRSQQAAPNDKAATATPSSPTDLRSLSSMDIQVELTPAVPFSTDVAATTAASAKASAAAGNIMPPFSGDVMKAEEMELLETITLRRLKSLGADTTPFENAS